MATQAQTLANQANAQHSTGPRTEEGKARSARNSRKHGLSTGVLVLAPEDRARFARFEAELRAEVNAEGAFEREALQQFLDAAARIDKIKSLIGEVIDAHREDPLLVPAFEAELAQLTRYRAAAEMLAYRAAKTLRELQTARLFRAFHLTTEEQSVLPPLAAVGQKIMLDGQLLRHNDREIFYHLYGAASFTARFPWRDPAAAVNTFSGSNPISVPHSAGGA